MNTYIINLDESKSNLIRTKNELKKINYNLNNVYKFSAVNGKKIDRNKEYIHPFCRILCTDKTIGCGLSHIKLCKKLKNENVNIALILEDDIKTLPNMNLNNELNNVIIKINKINPSWDIIILHKQGYCKEMERSLGKMCGSTAAYLISKSGINKMADLKLSYHIDHNRNSKLFNTYGGPNLFDTYEKKSDYEIQNNFMILNKPFSFWKDQDIIRDPFTNTRFGLLFILLLLIFINTIIFYYTLTKNRLYISIIVFITIVTLLLTYVFYSNNDLSYYRCSDITHYFGIIFPIVIIIVLFLYLKSNIIIFTILYSLSLSMLFFHLFYHYDKFVEAFKNN